MSTGLPDRPLIDQGIVVRDGPRPLRGPIAAGETFAWEPDLPHARALAVVTQVTRHMVRTRNVEGGDYCWNGIGRFREACFRTTRYHEDAMTKQEAVKAIAEAKTVADLRAVLLAIVEKLPWSLGHHP